MSDQLLATYCVIHGIHAGVTCPECAGAGQQRELLNVLEARIADLVAENLDLRRRVSALEHGSRGSART